MTSFISSGLRIRFGILRCEVVRKTYRAIAVMPGVFAISRKAGAPATSGCDGLSPSTTWHATQTRRARSWPAAKLASCANARRTTIVRTAASVAKRANCCTMNLDQDPVRSTMGRTEPTKYLRRPCVKVQEVSSVEMSDWVLNLLPSRTALEPELAYCRRRPARRSTAAARASGPAWG